ncbi:MAG: hypothetical protein EON58_15645 [Alphaproteobacteria bacterium]|nr:MAG: hypothetical protein EON58_15645 [Alphaproteobacteria bacterium]
MRNIENAGIEVRQLDDRDEIISVPEAGSEYDERERGRSPLDPPTRDRPSVEDRAASHALRVASLYKHNSARWYCKPTTNC